MSKEESAAIQILSHDTTEDERYMRRALSVAEAALRVGEVPVGCVIVLNRHPSFPDEENASVVISHGANQVNATRDATRHAEVVAIDRILTQGASSDQLRLPLSVGTKTAPGHSSSTVYPEHVMNERKARWDDRWTNCPDDAAHWKNSFGWGSSTANFTIDIFQDCTLYVTCEPCIMCAAALATVGIKKVVFGCKNDRFGGCGSLLHLHEKEVSDEPSMMTSHGYKIVSGVLETEAITLLRSFYDRENFHAPDDKRKRKEGKSGP